MKLPSNKTFKFTPIDLEQQKQIVEKSIIPKQNFYEFQNEICPFSFEGESSEFNEWFFNGEFKQTDALEILYVSPYQKTSLLNYLLISFYTSPSYLNCVESKNQSLPELIYVDTSGNFNILAMHGLISENLIFRSTSNPNFKNKNYVEELMNIIFSHLHVYKVYDITQFMSTLRLLPYVIEKNKQIKLIIIDSINSFPAYESKTHYNKNYGNKTNFINKEKNITLELYNKNATVNKTIDHLRKIVEEIKMIRKVGFITTMKEIYRTNEMIGFNFNERCLHAHNQLLKSFNYPIFKESSMMIFLMNFYNFEETALNNIYNDMEILQKLDFFYSKNYSVADIINNGNLSFAVKFHKNKASDILCYNFNRSNFCLLKIYPCLFN